MSGSHDVEVGGVVVDVPVDAVLDSVGACVVLVGVAADGLVGEAQGGEVEFSVVEPFGDGVVEVAAEVVGVGRSPRWCRRGGVCIG